MRQRCQAEGLPYEEGDFTDDASGVVVAAGKPLGMRSIPCANCFSVASTSDIGPLRPGANGLETCGLSSSSIGCSATSPAICQCSTACTSGGASASSGPRANLRLRRARPRRPKILAQQPCWRAVAPPHSTSTAAQGLALSSSALDLADRDWRSSSWRRGALASRDEEEGCVLDDDDWDGGMGVAGYLRAHCRRSSPGLPPSAAQSRRCSVSPPREREPQPQEDFREQDPAERARQVLLMRRQLLALSDNSRLLVGAPHLSGHLAREGTDRGSSNGGTFREILRACGTDEMSFIASDCIVHEVSQSNASSTRGRPPLGIEQSAQAVVVAPWLQPQDPRMALLNGGSYSKMANGPLPPPVPAAQVRPPMVDSDDEDSDCEHYIPAQEDGRIVWRPKVALSY